MRKLLNRLFGWDYVYYEAFMTRGMFRVRTLPDGQIYIKPYINEIEIIKRPTDVLWLTCLPSKYFPNQ